MIILHRRVLRLLLSLLSLCLLSLGTAACSVDSPPFAARNRPQPAVRPVTPAARGSSPTPSASTQDALEAGVRAWFEAVNRAFATGDTAALVEHTERTCACVNLIQHIHAAWAAGGIRGLTWTPRHIYVLDINYHVAGVQLDFDESPYRVVVAGRLSPTHRADSRRVLADFALTGGTWRLWHYNEVGVSPR